MHPLYVCPSPVLPCASCLVLCISLDATLLSMPTPCVYLCMHALLCILCMLCMFASPRSMHTPCAPLRMPCPSACACRPRVPAPPDAPVPLCLLPSACLVFVHPCVPATLWLSPIVCLPIPHVCLLPSARPVPDPPVSACFLVYAPL